MLRERTMRFVRCKRRRNSFAFQRRFSISAFDFTKIQTMVLKIVNNKQ